MISQLIEQSKSYSYNMDCMDALRDHPDKWFDLAIVDPPYGIDFQSARRIERKRKKKIVNDKTPYTEWIGHLFEKLKDGGACICFYRYDVQDWFYDAFADAGYLIKGQGVWDKVVHGMGDLGGGIAPQHELFLYCTKGIRKFTDTRPKSIIRVQRSLPDGMIHPNEKPIQLYRQLYEQYLPNGGRAVDLFLGSGSNRIAAHLAGNVEFFGYEIDKDYYEAQEKRFKNYIAQTKLF
jgi:site-specific DNA-methyltransferase (adenine-specific)